MQPNLIVFTGVTFLHDLFTAVWIGGLIVTGLVVLPTVKKVLGMSPQTRQLMLAIQRRLRVFVYISIVGLIITGVSLSRRSPQFLGLLSWGNTYSALLALKHLLVILMIIVALVRSIVFGRVEAPAAGMQKAGSDGPAPWSRFPQKRPAVA